MSPLVLPQFDPLKDQAVGSGNSRPQIFWPTMTRGHAGYHQADVLRFPSDEEHHARYALGMGGAMSAGFRSEKRETGFGF